MKPLDFGRAFEENVGVISLRTAFLCLAAVLAGWAQQPGVRLLDYLDQHAYLAPGSVAFASAGSAATQALRLDSTRVFWDPAYVVTGDYWIKDGDGVPVRVKVGNRTSQEGVTVAVR